MLSKTIIYKVKLKANWEDFIIFCIYELIGKCESNKDFLYLLIFFFFILLLFLKYIEYILEYNQYQLSCVRIYYTPSLPPKKWKQRHRNNKAFLI